MNLKGKCGGELACSSFNGRTVQRDATHQVQILVHLFLHCCREPNVGLTAKYLLPTSGSRQKDAVHGKKMVLPTGK
jgi:hypothetical protein